MGFPVLCSKNTTEDSLEINNILEFPGFLSRKTSTKSMKLPYKKL